MQLANTRNKNTRKAYLSRLDNLALQNPQLMFDVGASLMMLGRNLGYGAFSPGRKPPEQTEQTVQVVQIPVGEDIKVILIKSPDTAGELAEFRRLMGQIKSKG